MAKTELEQSSLISALTLPEQIVIWTLRHCLYLGAGATRAGLQQVVGELQIESALKSFTAMTACLPEKGAGHIASPGAVHATRQEMDILHLTALSQRQVNISFVLRHLRWLCTSNAGKIVCAVIQIAEDMKRAKQLLPIRAADFPVQSEVSEQVHLPAVHKLNALSQVEKQLLVGVRVWVHAVIHNLPTTPPVDQYFTALQQRTLVAPLCAALRNTALNATRSLDVHCPGCANISIDEARLLQAVSATQTGGGVAIRRIAGTWLPAGPLQKFAADIGELARRMVHLDKILPHRRWQFPETHAGNSSWDAERLALSSKILH